MDQEIIMRASELEQHSQQMEQSLEILDSQLLELEQFNTSLEELGKTNEKEMLASLGKGVFVKTDLNPEKKLYIEVGAGVVLKKTPEQAKSIIESQLSKLKEARVQIISEIESSRNQLQEIILSLAREQSGKQDDSQKEESK